MTYAPMQALADFHKAMGEQPVDIDNLDRILDLRRALIEEEAGEVDFALSEQSTNDIAKELADLLVVTYGTAERLGIPLEDVFNEVMRSNMSKLGDDGKPVFREDGKILKGPNYSPADLTGILGEETSA